MSERGQIIALAALPILSLLSFICAGSGSTRALKPGLCCIGLAVVCAFWVSGLSGTDMGAAFALLFIVFGLAPIVLLIYVAFSKWADIPAASLKKSDRLLFLLGGCLFGALFWHTMKVSGVL